MIKIFDEFKYPSLIEKNDLFKFSSEWMNGIIFGLIHSQTPSTFFLMDCIIKENLNIDTFIEIGTGGGAQTLQYAMWTKKRKGKVYSYHKYPLEHIEKEHYEFLKILGVTFIHEDAYTEKAIENIENIIIEVHKRNKNILLFCDGENRDTEFKIFLHLMKKNDIILFHDYIEGNYENLLNNFKKYRQNDFNNLQTNILCLKSKG